MKENEGVWQKSELKKKEIERANIQGRERETHTHTERFPQLINY